MASPWTSTLWRTSPDGVEHRCPHLNLSESNPVAQRARAPRRSQSRCDSNGTGSTPSLGARSLTSESGHALSRIARCNRGDRVHDELRISVNDRCNPRRVHRKPEEGMTCLLRSQPLEYEEITQLSRVVLPRRGVNSA